MTPSPAQYDIMKHPLKLCPICKKNFGNLYNHLKFKHEGIPLPRDIKIVEFRPKITESPESVARESIAIEYPNEEPKTITLEEIKETETREGEEIPEHLKDALNPAPSTAPETHPAPTVEKLPMFFDKKHGEVIGKLPFNIMSYFFNPCFKLTQEEIETIGEPMAMVLNRYLSKFEHVELLILGMVFGSILLTKCDEYVKIRKKEDEEKKAKEQKPNEAIPPVETKPV